jgi:hypothetical protein
VCGAVDPARSGWPLRSGHKKVPASIRRPGHSLRGQDLNLRPLGYEPSELPNCSTPRYVSNGITARTRPPDRGRGAARRRSSGTAGATSEKLRLAASHLGRLRRVGENSDAQRSALTCVYRSAIACVYFCVYFAGFSDASNAAFRSACRRASACAAATRSPRA